MSRYLFIVATIALFSGAAYAAKAHVHGTGSLDVVIDRGQITLSLELPLDVAVGFERAPKSENEKAALAATEKTLHDAAALFIPTTTANCTPQSVKVEMPNSSGGEHADIDATYSFSCATPAQLKSIETTIFKHFKRLYRLETRRVGPGNQGAARLSPKQPTLSW
jgi:hypothetical protein